MFEINFGFIKYSENCIKIYVRFFLIVCFLFLVGIFFFYFGFYFCVIFVWVLDIYKYIFVYVWFYLIWLLLFILGNICFYDDYKDLIGEGDYSKVNLL